MELNWFIETSYVKYDLLRNGYCSFEWVFAKVDGRGSMANPEGGTTVVQIKWTQLKH